MICPPCLATISLVITLLLHVLRLLPFLFGGHRQLALENLALRQQLAVYKRTPLGRPRIHGELLKLGIEIAERTVSRLMPKRRPELSQTWRTFLANHLLDLVSIDFFTVPTARFRVLSSSCSVTPAGIEEVLTAPHSPWQNPFAERLIGSIRRKCLKYVLVLGERHLCRILTRCLVYYHQTRTHLALDKDAPNLRPIERPGEGKIVQGEVLHLLENGTGMHSCLVSKPKVAGWRRRQEEASPWDRESGIGADEPEA